MPGRARGPEAMRAARPLPEAPYYSEPAQPHLPRYEVQFEIKILYLLLQQIERLYKGFCYCSVFINI